MDKPEAESRTLMRALISAQRDREHTVAELACALGTSPSHWYRLKRDPALLAHCRKSTLRNMAAYINWPFDKVRAAVIGTFFSADHMPQESLEEILRFISRSEYSTGLLNPLEKAAPDHQALVIHLFCAHQAAAAWIAAHLRLENSSQNSAEG